MAASVIEIIPVAKKRGRPKKVPAPPEAPAVPEPEPAVPPPQPRGRPKKVTYADEEEPLPAAVLQDPATPPATPEPKARGRGRPRKEPAVLPVLTPADPELHFGRPVGVAKAAAPKRKRAPPPAPPAPEVGYFLRGSSFAVQMNDRLSAERDRKRAVYRNALFRTAVM
jgi:hypothetical protein